MIRFRSFAFLLSAILSIYGVAQSEAPVVLHEGTPVSLAFAGAMNSGTAVIGDRIQFVLADEIKIDGTVVAKAGCIVFGQVTGVKRAALAGRSGEISLRLDGLLTGGKTIKLRGSKERSGPSEIQYSHPYHLKWPGGLMRTGDNVEINTGTQLTVYVAEDISLPIED